MSFYSAVCDNDIEKAKQIYDTGDVTPHSVGGALTTAVVRKYIEMVHFIMENCEIDKDFIKFAIIYAEEDLINYLKQFIK